MNIWSLRPNFVDCESFLESNLDDSIDSGNFSLKGYLPLVWKDSSIHMHGLAVYLKEELLHGTYLENSADSCSCFWLAVLHSVSYFFFLYWSPSLSLCTVFDSISSNILSSGVTSDDFWIFYFIFPVIFTTDISFCECVKMIVPVSSLFWISATALLHKI